MADVELVNIKINGIPLQVPKGEKIIESARRIGVDIPFFCYHPRLSMEEGGANCRMCLVEVATRAPDGSVRKMPKPQTSCSLPASEGMEIQTETEQIAKDRRGIVEFLLLNHPLDCPICDRGGECPLQNNTLHYGPPTSRFVEEKRHFPKAYPLSTYVVFDRERCIHCARCTRFTVDISGDRQLAFLYRAADMEVATFEHTEFQSLFSGNVIEVCPVGALLSRTYRFKARPWDLLTQKSICTQCSNGCNIKIDYRVNALQRVLARENNAVNEEWTCDKGKFGMAYVSSDERLRQPLVRRDGELQPATWDEASRLIVEKLKAIGPAVGGIGGAKSPNEDIYVWQRFFRETLKSGNLDHRMGPNFGPTSNALYERSGHHTMGNAIAGLENMKTVLVFGSVLPVEQPIVYLRVRKGWRFKRMNVVEALPASANPELLPNHVSEFAAASLRYRPGTEVSLIRALMGALPAEPGAPARETNIGPLASECGVDEALIRKAAGLLGVQGMAVLAGQAVANHPQSGDVLNALCDLAEATGNGGNVNLPVTECNQQGAMDLGILPDMLPGYVAAPQPGLNTQQMLEAAISGDLQALWLVQADLLNEFHNQDLVRRALEACPFIIANELTLTETAREADVVLPVQSVAEREGTFTNVERRVQRFWRAFEVAPEIHPGWVVFQDIAARMEVPPAYFSPRDILADINANVPIYRNCTRKALGDQGVRWEYLKG